MNIKRTEGVSHYLAVLLVIGSVFCAAPVTQAAIYTVTNLADSGPGSLRQAILDANARPGADVIQFEPGLCGTVGLSTDQLSITDDLTIEGPGANVLEVSALGMFRVLLIGSEYGDSGVVVQISGLSITHGCGYVCGGGVFNGGTLTLDRCNISWNSTICPIDQYGNNYGWGGGIYNAGVLVLANSTLSWNTANASAGYGGGVYNDGELTVVNSTVSHNVAGLDGGGVCHIGPMPAVILHSTITLNAAQWGGGIYSGPALEMRNSILAGNYLLDGVLWDGAGPDLCGFLAVSGYNLIGDGTGGEGYGKTDLVGMFRNKKEPIDPLLGELADNGGPTPTHALLPGSPASNAGDPAFDPYAFDPPLLYDQRGEGHARVLNDRLDIGAVEMPATEPPDPGKKPKKTL